MISVRFEEKALLIMALSTSVISNCGLNPCVQTTAAYPSYNGSMIDRAYNES